MMACHKPECVGDYDFSRIAFFARKRFVEGCKTVDLMGGAKSEREREEIALVSLLDIEDDQVQDLQLSCKNAGQCKVIDCRKRLKGLIEKELKNCPR